MFYNQQIQFKFIHVYSYDAHGTAIIKYYSNVAARIPTLIDDFDQQRTANDNVLPSYIDFYYKLLYIKCVSGNCLSIIAACLYTP